MGKELFDKINNETKKKILLRVIQPNFKSKQIIRQSKLKN